MASRDFEIKFRAEAEFSEAQRALRNAQKEIERVGRSVGKTNRSIAQSGATIAKPLDASAVAMRRTALSSRELRFATRQLPAQFTDIATSLQAGQNPMQVLIQQGGQLKDIFGGIGPAARAMGGYIAGLINPLTVAAAAVAALGVAWYKADQRQSAFTRALVLSGNRVRSSAEDLRLLAVELDDIAGVTEGGASDALAKIAESGKFAEGQFRLVTEAALRMQAAAGTSLDTTIDKFVELGDDPVDALLKLNEAERFLTRAQLDRVQALQAEGREQEAATEAIRIYARVTEDRAEQIAQSLGSIPSLWREIKEGTLESGDAIVGWAGTVDRALGDAANRLARFRLEQEGLARLFLDTYFDVGNPFSEVQSTVTTTGQQPDVVDSAAERARIEANEKFEQIASSNLSKRERLEREIAEIREIGLEAGKSALEIEKQVTAARARNAGSARRPGGGARGADPNAAAKRALDNLRKELALLDQLEAGERRASEAAKARYEIAEGAYSTAAPALQQQILATAELLDQERLRADLAKQLAGVNLDKLRLQGRGAEAAVAATVLKLEELKAKLADVGNTAGAATVVDVIALTRARAAMDALAQSVQRFQAQQSRGEQRISVALEAGLISQIEAQERLLELRQQEIAFLQQQIPLLQQQAQLTASPETLARLEQMKLRLFELQNQSSLLVTTLRNGFETGLANALEGLATGTLTVREAFNALVLDVAQGMARLAAQQLASAAASKLTQMLGGGDQAGIGSGATKLSSAAGKTVVAGGVLVFGASRLSAAAKELTAAAAALTIANSIGAATGFAAGGFTGAGGKHDLAGYVHRGEYVMPKATVQRYGLGLMQAIHHGMLPAARFAGVGMPQVNVPRAPQYSFAEGGLASSAAPPGNRLSVYNLFDVDALAQRLANHPAVEEKIVVVASDNGRTIRAAW